MNKGSGEWAWVAPVSQDPTNMAWPGCSALWTSEPFRQGSHLSPSSVPRKAPSRRLLLTCRGQVLIHPFLHGPPGEAEGRPAASLGESGQIPKACPTLCQVLGTASPFFSLARLCEGSTRALGSRGAVGSRQTGQNTVTGPRGDRMSSGPESLRAQGPPCSVDGLRGWGSGTGRSPPAPSEPEDLPGQFPYCNSM